MVLLAVLLAGVRILQMKKWERQRVRFLPPQCPHLYRLTDMPWLQSSSGFRGGSPSRRVALKCLSGLHI